jgi:hypothetical protein
VRWQMLDMPEDRKSDKFKFCLRLNSLGSLYFFEKYTLQRDRLTFNFHKRILDQLENDGLREMFNIPRDHLKTTMTTEGRSMWRTLPFTELDEICMRELGYGDDWIAWMHRIHNPARRILTISEVIKNAVDLGHRIDWHFQENDLFKWAFSDILPDSKCRWNDESKQIKCRERGPNGEGTFDFLGVGAALQSRHYTDVTEDDPVGKDALESVKEMDKIISYHQLLIGAFDRFVTGAWMVIMNLWSPTDLAAWIKKNQPEFKVHRHSALGGCCDWHPEGEPIFPEEFSKETLAEIRRIQGPYFFSHQYLNIPVAPEECKFSKDWLRFYSTMPSPIAPGKVWLKHAVKAGEVLASIDPKSLIKTIVIDPNHAEEKGRSRHAVVVTGLDPENDRIYLLDLWARSASYDDLMKNLFDLAIRWGMHEVWVESIAGQRLLRYPIEMVSKSRGWQMTMREIKADRGYNAKVDRIESLEPIYRGGQFWVRDDQAEFLDEYYGYPGYPTRDILDALGYAVNTWNVIHAKKVLDAVRARKERMYARKGHTGY